MSAEVGSAHIAIFPVMKGFKSAISGVMKDAGRGSSRLFTSGFKDVGKMIGSRIGADMRQAVGQVDVVGPGLSKVRQEVARSTAALQRARLAQQDSAGKVRVAEAKLAEVMSKHPQDAARVVKAEEDLASARRRGEASANAFTMASDRLKAAQQSLAQVTSTVGAAVERQRGGIRQFGSDFMAGANSAKAAQSAFTGVAGALGGVTRALGEGVSVPLHNFVAGLSRANSALSNSTSLMFRFGSSTRDVLSAIAGVGRDIAAPFVAFAGRVRDVAGQVGQTVSSMMSRFSEAVRGALSAVAGVARGLVAPFMPAIDAVRRVGTAIGHALVDPIRNAAQTVGGIVASVAHRVGGIASSVAQRVASSPLGVAVGSLGQKIGSAFGAQFQRIGEMAVGVGSRVLGAFGGLPGRIASALGSAGSAGVRALGSGLVNGAQAAFHGLVSAARSAAGAVANTFRDSFQAVKSVGTVAIGALAGVIASQLGPALHRVDLLNNFPKVMKNLGYSSDDASRSIKKISESLVGLPSSTDEIANFVQQLAPISGSLGKATDVGLAFNNMLLASGKGTADVNRAMQQYTQQLAKGKVDLSAWRTLQEVMPGQLNQMSVALLGAGKNSMDLYEAMKNGKVSFNDFNDALLKVNRDGVAGFASFSQQAQDATKGIGTAFENVKNAITRNMAKVVNAIGADKIADAIGSVSGVIDNLGNRLATLFEGFSKGKGGVDQLTNSFGAFAPVIGLVVGGLGSLLSGLPLIGGLFAGITGPVGLLVGSFVGAYTQSDLLRNSLNNLGAAIQNAFSGAPALIGPLQDAFGTVLKGIGDGLSNVVDVVASIVSSFSNLDPTPLDTIKVAASNLSAIFEGIGQGIAAFVDGLADGLKPVIEAIYPQLQEFGTYLGDTLPAAFATTGAVLGDMARALGDLLKPAIELLLPPIRELTQAVLDFINDAVAQWGPKITEIIRVATPVVEWLSGVLKPAFEVLGPVVKTVFDTIVKVIGGALDVISGIIKTVTAIFKGDWKGAWEGMQQIASGVWNAIKGIVEGAINVVKGIIDGVLGTIRNIWDSAWTGMGNALRGAWDGIVGFIRSIPGGIVNALGDLGGLLWGAGQAILDGLLGGLRAAWDGVTGFIGGIGSWIAEHKGPRSYDLKLLVPAGNWIMQGLDAGLDAGFDDVQKRVQKMGPQMRAAFSSPVLDASIHGTPSVHSMSADTRNAPVMGGGNVYIDKVINPISEPSSVTASKKLQVASELVGGFV